MLHVYILLNCLQLYHCVGWYLVLLNCVASCCTIAFGGTGSISIAFNCAVAFGGDLYIHLGCVSVVPVLRCAGCHPVLSCLWWCRCIRFNPTLKSPQLFCWNEILNCFPPSFLPHKLGKRLLCACQIGSPNFLKIFSNRNNSKMMCSCIAFISLLSLLTK